MYRDSESTFGDEHCPKQISVTVAPKVKLTIGTHTHTAEMFEQFLCPFLDPDLQKLTVPSVPCEKQLNACEMVPVCMDFAHLPPEDFCLFFGFLGGRAWAKQQTVIHVGSCYNGKGKKPEPIFPNSSVFPRVD